MLVNAVTRKWEIGSTAYGTTLSLGSVRSAELSGRAGFDFVMVDMQHGYFDKQSATDAIRAIAVTSTVPFARVAHNDPGRINDLLDAGALGIVVPTVNSARGAQAAVEATFYHPKGARSMSGAAATFYGKEYPEIANDVIVLVPMVETAAAVERVEEIVSVEGVGACLIGTSDLMHSLSCAAMEPRFMDAIDEISAACSKHDVPLGIAGGAAAEATEEKPNQPGLLETIKNLSWAIINSLLLLFTITIMTCLVAPIVAYFLVFKLMREVFTHDYFEIMPIENHE